MSDFLRRAQPRHPVAAPAQALARDGLPPGSDPATLIVLEQRGSYSGRRVSYFRVINPVRTPERAIQVGVFSDLDDHPELIVRSGHVEHDGAVVLTWRDGGHSTARQTGTRWIEPITATTSNASSRVRPLERQPATKGKRE